MPQLTNFTEKMYAGVPVVCADFRVGDGRLGNICVLKAEYDAHGEIVLQQLADACANQAMGHGYQPPGQDRYEELR